MNINKEELVNSADTELLDSQIDQITNSFIEEHFLDNDEAEQLEMLVAKSMKLGELYERKKWQEKATPEGFVLIEKECPDPIFADNLFADLKTRSFIYDGEEFINLCDIDPIVVWKMVIEAQEQSYD
ncbi:hypothetical protein [Acinetobacter bereziniae]|uniref:hypothetical protein n=1 Tax=Acinetobacter bereziniae TaxID=106648 RepID=UPI0015DB71C2|nr:hypothetical protein [Acinetobacter bereziniae]